MSKSLGNFYTTREILEKFEPEEVRYFLLTTHYHNPINFNYEEVEKTGRNLASIKSTRKRLENIKKKYQDKVDNTSNNVKKETVDKINGKNFRKKFEQAMNNDFNTAEAIGVLNNLVKTVNKFINNKNFKINEETISKIKNASNLIDDILSVLGIKLDLNKEKKYGEKFEEILEYVLELREKARQKENYELADTIREDLKEMGIEIKDTPHGVEWKLKEK